MDGRARLTWVTQKRLPHGLEPGDSPVSIGSAEGNDLVLDDIHVSANHATLVAQGGGWVLNDTSTNGTRICRADAAPRRELGTSRALHDRDVLIFGSTELRFKAQPLQKTAPLEEEVYVPPRRYAVLMALSAPMRNDDTSPPASEREIEAKLLIGNDALRDQMKRLYIDFAIPTELTQAQRRMVLARSWSRATPIREP